MRSKLLGRIFLLACCILASNAIDVSSCNKTKSCIIQPSGCSPTKPTCLVFTYSWDSPKNIFNLELSGGEGNGHQYVAAAFSPDGKMENSDLYYCTGQQLISGVIGERYSTPVSSPTLPENVTSTKVQTMNGVAMCSFTRGPSVFKNISGKITEFNLLAKQFFVLQAFGNVTNGTLHKHQGETGRFSTGPFNFTQSAVTGHTTVPPVTTPAHSSNISAGCGKTKGCFFNPTSCTPGTSTCMFMSWTYDSKTNNFDFEIMGGNTGQYAAVAFGIVNKMQDADLYYCTEHGFFSGAIQDADKSPSVSSSLPNGLSDIKYSLVDGALRCGFRRPAAISKVISNSVSHDFNLAKSTYYLMFALGNADNGSLTYHGKTKAISNSMMNFTQFSYTNSSDTSINMNLVKAHASLMLIAWLTCASVGVFVSRHFKLLWNISASKPKLWFRVHRTLMILVMLCTIAGFVLIFVAKKEYSSNAGAHSVLGIIVTALAIINPIMATFRPEPAAPKRPLFNWFHSFVGNLARITSLAAMFFGVHLPLINLPNWHIYFLLGFVIFHLFVEVILEIASAEYGHIPDYKLAKQEVFKVDREPLIGKSLQGEVLKNSILLVYVLVNIGVLATFLTFIIRN